MITATLAAPRAQREIRIGSHRKQALDNRLRSDVFARLARLEVWQDGRRLATGSSFGMKPDRPVRLSASWTGRADPGGGPVTVRLA